MSYETNLLDKELHTLLNYGGIFFEDGEVEYAWEIGDLDEEVAHMRKLASVLDRLAASIDTRICCEY